MPGRGLARAGFLDQQVVVVQTHRPALHELGGDVRQCGVAQDLLVGRVVLPGAEIFNEAARIVGLAGHQGQRAQVREVVLDAGFQLAQLFGVQHAPQHHRAVAGIGMDGIGGDRVLTRHAFSRRTFWRCARCASTDCGR
ncbi:MAG: hypothetical protein A3B67_13625 [Burkholderiales bacterium RIFCSPHIGHO2_02_FULL_66_10]|nr:MAG: hypothetical protein A3B67_13625 [Burkholderiales bacterium RIFCSPHIGHO2_02_FULL_66_10]